MEIHLACKLASLLAFLSDNTPNNDLKFVKLPSNPMHALLKGS